MTQPRKRVAVLISGRGSNMMSLVEAARAPDYPAEIVCVISNRPEAPGLAWAAAQGIATVAIDHKAYATRVAFEAKLHTAILDARGELVCMAGFLRMLTGGFIDRWRDRLVNIHPSLLPSFPGLDTHARALDEGVKIVGCTVHLVRLEMDTGPIIAQAAVPVLPEDTPETLGSRVLKAEHRLYPHALKLFASGQARVVGETIQILQSVNQDTALFSPSF